MTDILDTSALLAYLQGEEGADVVERVLDTGARCSTAAWSEVAQKVTAHGRDWALARSLLLNWSLDIEPVTSADAERAADRWSPRSPQSLADRLCLALADRHEATAWTADAACTDERARQIR